MQRIGREKQHRFVPYPHGEAEIERDGAAMRLRLRYAGAYGMGEKYDFFNQKGNTVVNRVEEKFCFQGEKTYCAAPFFWTDTGFGLYVDSCETTVFSFGEEEIGVTLPEEAEAVLFTGSPEEIVREYMGLFGKAALPPDWVFAPWISANRWNTQAEAEEADAALSACIDALLEQAASYGTAEVDYSAVTLAPMTVADISAEDLLYPDVGFQRFPEVPLYLQQDYGNLRFGSQYLSIAGCGMCSMAMVSTYMTDTVYTPAMIVELFPQYYGEIGADGTIFLNGPADLGFYASSQLRSWEDILAKLQQGDPIVTLQIHGVFTTGGHFMVLSRGYEDGTVTVRDSNLKNYARLDGYKTDRFTKEEVLSGGILFYTFQPKLVTLPGCIRCGEGSDTARDYLCEKCAAALTRWEAFLGIDNWDN